jgi:hypothetical protein
MVGKLCLLVTAIAAHPARVRLALFAVSVALAAVGALAPGMTALAGDMPGGGH